ncbi:MAG: DUF3592 domain-containing protein [Actinomycetota bacterium]|nr:DUF3592 domain-containing protein [Actinomycetota bacterium]
MNMVLAVALGLGGVAVLVWAIAVVASQLLFDLRAARATGTVVALEAVGTTPSAVSEVGMTYRPIVRFVDQQGRSVDFTSPTGYSPPRHRPGTTIGVDYDPKHPERASLVGTSAGATPLVLGGLGIVPVAMSAACSWCPREGSAMSAAMAG